MSYTKNVSVHKVTQSVLDSLYRDYPFTVGRFEVVDTLELAVSKAVKDTNDRLPTQEAVLEVLNAYEDEDNSLYHIALKIMD